MTGSEGSRVSSPVEPRQPMRISVVIPCHNAGRWIETALRSVAEQSYPPHEVIVIDDRSTDDSVARVETMGVADRLLRVDAGNAAAARNAGIEAATGDWIALLDADDVWYPHHLARAFELLSGTADVAFMANHDWISLDGAVIPIPDEFRCKLTAPRSGLSVDDYYRIAARGFHFGHSTVLYRRDRLIEAGGFDVQQKRRHDIDLWLRVVVGRTWTYDTVASAGYRRTVPGSISRDEQECDYYYLRALDKNATRIDSPFFHAYLARQARRALGIAFVDGPPAHFDQIRTLAWPHLPLKYRMFYSAAFAWPGLVRALMKRRRRIVMGARGAPAALPDVPP
jgi:glycosyltransferase involved in cell wall biosynthesis